MSPWTAALSISTTEPRLPWRSVFLAPSETWLPCPTWAMWHLRVLLSWVLPARTLMFQKINSPLKCTLVSSKSKIIFCPPSPNVHWLNIIFLDGWRFSQQDSQLQGASGQMQGSLNAEYLPANGSIQEAAFFRTCDDDDHLHSSYHKHCDSENDGCESDDELAALVYRQPTLDSTTFHNLTSEIQLDSNAAEYLVQVNNTCSA